MPAMVVLVIPQPFAVTGAFAPDSQVGFLQDAHSFKVDRQSTTYANETFVVVGQS